MTQAYTHPAMLEALRQIADNSEHVRLDREQLQRVAEVMRTRLDLKLSHFNVRRDYPSLSPPDMLLFLMIVGAHNFLFWQRDESGEVVPWHLQVNGEDRHGFPAYMACHIRALKQGRNILDPDYLLSMTLVDIENYYRDEKSGQVTLQLLPERLARYHEMGRVLKEEYGGSILSIFEQAEGYLFRNDGNGLVQRFMADFPLTYDDWPFCKKILVNLGNLYQDRDQLIPADSEYRLLVEFQDPEVIEIGADYYRPFFFYRVGVLQLSQPFQARLSSGDFFKPGEAMEQEYRAWTILVGRELAQLLNVTPHDVAVETWAMGYMRCRPCYVGVSEGDVPCSYRPLCYSYTQDSVLMKSLWPLILTTKY